MPKLVPADADALDDLRARLRATRWPDTPEGVDGKSGIDVDFLRDLVAYWADGFDWRQQEAALNEFPHEWRNGIHAIHARGRGPAPFPLLLCHGWPDSFWRYLKVIPLLTDPGAHGGDPADAFDVVVPDMPGYGYSERPAQPLNVIDVANLWAALMTDLGHRRFGAAGGDLGSHVSRYLALDHPQRVAAVHRMDAGIPVFTGDPASLTPAERDFLQRAAEWGAREGAYGMMHRTKPQTAAVGLNDSPAGLAAWIVEKMQAWSGPAFSFTRDELLTNITIYWLTGTIGSSIRMYQANAAIAPAQLERRVEVPSGFTLFPGDLLQPPRAWLDRVANTVRVTEASSGGHFAPFEQPEAYARELRDFFRPYR
ncbi:epoxide hydrolase family protein [Paractinoplanes lichenicola]|uniref:Epoxide hydrolase n=1 Tax=Paractinoplanes lichenicola TaxID=2802976 RepID=A0ABS1VW56_9ACTN|nr:epoxide hydrolase family protein [Actinoplanes lichenicola]MBL7258720.1 epoxide hydrolase [Actinoplanes lichenicola]